MAATTRGKTRFLLYGAYGYTGRLASELAAARKLPVVLAGRNKAALVALGDQLSLPTRVVGVNDATELCEALRDVGCVVHMAGPFAATSAPMLNACLATQTNYVDITGEIEVFEAMWSQKTEIRRAEITVIPGAGFDVVPTDCLAGYVADKLEKPISLVIALRGLQTASQGTLRTAIRQISNPVLCRRAGTIVALEDRSTRWIDFGRGDEPCVPLSWGDVSTAFYSTGVGNITVYFRRTRLLRSVDVAGKLLGPFLRSSLGQRALATIVRRFPEDPSQPQRSVQRSTIWAEAISASGNSFRAILATPDAYDFAANSALEIASRIDRLQAPLGLATPFQAFGADFVLSLPGCSRTDIPSAKTDSSIHAVHEEHRSTDVIALRAALAEGWLFKDWAAQWPQRLAFTNHFAVRLVSGGQMHGLRDVLEQAQKDGVAVGHFNISDLVLLKAVFAAAHELKVPVVVGASKGERDFIGVSEIASLVRILREGFDFPIFLNADHTHSLPEAIEAARAGFDAIVFDVSALPFEENVRQTKEAVEALKTINPNILIEGELGDIGTGSEIHNKAPELSKGLTSPAQAREYVNSTAVDILAPAVGNMHGMLKSMLTGETKKHLDIERIAQIKDAARILLTLHGGSGTDDEDFRKAIAAGINMVHINTELRVAWRNGLEDAFIKHPTEVVPYKILPLAVESVKQVASSRLKLFNLLN
jgi:fructose-bisphosphate aldolase class II